MEARAIEKCSSAAGILRELLRDIYIFPSRPEYSVAPRNNEEQTSAMENNETPQVGLSLVAIN